MEKGTRAFVSLVRGYKEHHCKFVFRIQVGEAVKTIRRRGAASFIPCCMLGWGHLKDCLKHLASRNCITGPLRHACACMYKFPDHLLCSLFDQFHDRWPPAKAACPATMLGRSC